MAVGGWKGQGKGARGGRVEAVDGSITCISLAQNLDVSYFMSLNKTQCIPYRGRFIDSSSRMAVPDAWILLCLGLSVVL